MAADLGVRGRDRLAAFDERDVEARAAHVDRDEVVDAVQRPVRRAPASGPPAGPDSRVLTAKRELSSGLIAPPLDCMMSSVPSNPASPSRPPSSSR